MKNTLLAISVSGLVAALMACSSTSQPADKQGTGGAAGSGGSVGTGGTVAAGGSVGTGGTTSSTGGRTTGTGGNVTGSGGSTAGTGGRVTSTGGGATGGRSGTGGALSSGGSLATGGTGVATGGGGGGGTSLGSTGGTGSGGSTVGQDAGSTGGRGVDSGSVVDGRDGAMNEDGATSVDGGTLSSGCGKAMTRPDRKAQQTISIDGTTRYYLLNVPSNFDNKTPLPLVFALHGYDMNNIALVDLYDFTAQSGNKAITVLPQGEGPAPGTTSHWGDQVLKSTWTANTANYTFMQNLIAEIESRYCIDTARVFMTGFSMGGMFTNSLACAHSDWFRAYAPVAGMGPGTCADKDAQPAIMIHQGTADTTVTPAAGGEPSRDFWTKQNGCNTTTTSMYTGCQSYGACTEPVVYCVGNWNHTVSQTARANIWTFINSLQ